MKHYFINKEEVTEKKFYSILSGACYYEAEEKADDIIDSENEEVCIGRFSFSPSSVLKEVYPFGYNCYVNDIKNSVYSTAKFILENTGEVDAGKLSFTIEPDLEDED